MMNRFVFVITVVFTLLFSACNKEKRDLGKTLNIAISSKVKGFDPIYSNDRYSSNEIGRIYEGLLQFHYLKRPYQLAPNLAESMPTVSEDGLTYTFKIKKGVKFQDDEAFPEGKGRELVAQDFVYSIKRLADPKLQGLGWWLLDGKVKGLNEWRERNGERKEVDYSEVVEGLKATDSHTLQIKLSKPFPQFLYSLAMSFTFAVPREAVEKYGAEFINHPVGTGPFMLEDKVFKQNLKLTYVKNPNFRKETYPCDASEEFKEKGYLKNCGKTIPLVERIVVQVMEEDQPRWLNFNKGKVDYLSVPKDNFEGTIPDGKSLSPEFKEKEVKLEISPALDVTYTAFNHDLELFRNVKLRQAMSLAYDVERSNKLFYNSTALPAQSVVPPGIAGHIEGYKNPYRSYGKKEDLERAKKLLAEAGYPNGEGLPEISYDCPASTTSRQIGDFFKAQMAQIGVNIKVVQNPWPELQKKITNRQVMMYGIAWGADYPDAENFLQLLYGPNRAPGANGSGYDNPEFNQLFKTASVMQDSPERTALYEKMNRIAAEQMPWIYGVHRQSYTLKHAWLENFVLTDFEIGREKYLDIDEKKKKQVLEKL